MFLLETKSTIISGFLVWGNYHKEAIVLHIKHRIVLRINYMTPDSTFDLESKKGKKLNAFFC